MCILGYANEFLPSQMCLVTSEQLCIPLVAYPLFLHYTCRLHNMSNASHVNTSNSGLDQNEQSTSTCELLYQASGGTNDSIEAEMSQQFCQLCLKCLDLLLCLHQRGIIY